MKDKITNKDMDDAVNKMLDENTKVSKSAVMPGSVAVVDDPIMPIENYAKSIRYTDGERANAIEEICFRLRKLLDL